MDPSLTQGCDAPALPERATGELAFRVCGTEHDGRIVRLHARKCTIGSGEHCTLRLRARGIEPLHCVIIRGEHGTAVRRWAAKTRLNGGIFLDSPLRPGDRLGMGPLELEVIESNVVAPPAPGRDDIRGSREFDELSDRLAELELLLQEHEQQVEAAARLREEWRREREELVAQIEAAQTAAVFESDPPTQDQMAALEAAKAELEQLLERARNDAAAAAEKAEYWEQVALDHVAGEAAEERDALKRRIEGLESELHRAQAAEQTAILAEQASRELSDDRETRGRDAWEAELSTLREELEETRRSLGAERDDLQAQLAAAQEASAVRVSPEQFRAERREWEQTISDLRDELEQNRRNREVERARHENELADLRRAIAEKAATHVPQQETPDDSTTLEAERETLRRQRERQERELQVAREHHERKLEEAREHQERELREAREQLARFKAKLEERTEALDAREAELNRQAEVLAKLKLAAIAGTDAPSPDQIAGASESAAPSGGLATPTPDDTSLAAPIPQESAAEVLARMGYAPAWTEEDEPAAAQHTQAAPFTAGSAVEAAPVRAPEEDDSIEDYMNRLLQRVRGDDVGSSYRPPASTTRTAPVNRSGPPPQPKPGAATTAAKANIASLLGPAANAPVPTSGTMTAEEYVPRSQAPEQSERLAAMRDLANTSARSAIGRHTRALWLAKTLSRFGMAIGAAAACVFLVLFSSASPTLATSGAAIGAAASGFWLLRGLRDAKRFMRARREKHPPQ